MGIKLCFLIFICLSFASCVEGSRPGAKKSFRKNDVVARPTNPTSKTSGNSYSNGHSLSFYINEYKEAYEEHTGRAANISGVRIELKLDDQMNQYGISANSLGVCFEDERIIWLRRSSWDRLPDFDRRALVFHEYGHCHLRREHKTSLFNGSKLSLLHPIGSFPLYERYTWEYDEELFNRDESHLRQVL